MSPSSASGPLWPELKHKFAIDKCLSYKQVKVSRHIDGGGDKIEIQR